MNLNPGNYAVNQAGYMLGEISKQMHLAGKPMLSALIINQDKGIPGNGFFELAILIGKITAGVNEQGKVAFWKKELEAIYATKWQIIIT